MATQNRKKKKSIKSKIKFWPTSMGNAVWINSEISKPITVCRVFDDVCYVIGVNGWRGVIEYKSIVDHNTSLAGKDRA